MDFTKLDDWSGLIHCDYDITVVLHCPDSERFPGENGCGRIFAVYGISGDISNLITDIQQWKNKKIRCSLCHYQFNPYEVYI